ncbi:MMPL family transporter [Mycoplasmatota bacterium]|nr:MMPL family transporter [Mycoplasmatota bacterium]
MKKLADGIVKSRYVLMLIFAVLVGVSIILIPKVKTNYDMTKYLDEDSKIVEAYEKMEEDFGKNGSAQIMINDITIDEAEIVKQKIEKIDGVDTVVFDSTSEKSYKDGKALFQVFLKDGDFDIEVYDTVDAIEKALDGYSPSYYGAAVVSKYMSEAAHEDMAKILAIACVIVFAILLLTSTSWVDPIMFTVVVATSIFINLGTNYFLEEISFVTGSICAVMQLALAMDYSIILLQKFNENVKKGMDNKKAISDALKSCFSPISSSSLTTIAGLVALMFMQFTIGLDVGIVLSKGIVISILTVFLLMPGVLLLFAPLIEKTRHKSIFNVITERKEASNKHLIVKFQYKTRYIIPVILLVLIICAGILTANSDYRYSLDTARDKNAQINVDDRKIEEAFGIQNSLVVLVPKGDHNKEKEVIDVISNYKINGKNIINNSQGMVSTGLYDELTAAQIANVFHVSEDIVNSAFLAMDKKVTDKVIVNDFLNYISTEEYAIGLANSKQTELDVKYEQLKPYFTNISSTEIEEQYLINKEVIQLVYQGLGKDVTKDKISMYEFLKYINENQLINNIFVAKENTLTEKYNSINTELNMATVKGLYSLTDEQVQGIFFQITGAVPTVDTIIYNYQLVQYFYNGLDQLPFNAEQKAQIIGAYQQMFTELTATQISVSYPVFNDETMGLMFSAYSKNYETDTLPVYQLVNFMHMNNILTKYGQLAQTEMDGKYAQLAPAGLELTKANIIENYGISDELVQDVFTKLNVTDKVRTYELVEYLSQNNLVATTGVELQNIIDEKYDQSLLADKMFNGNHYTRLLFNMNLDVTGDEAFEAIEKLEKEINKIYDESYILSESANFLEIKDIFSSDSTVVSLISFFSILLIVMLTFKSVSIPVILTLIIQGSIWIGMSFSILNDNPAFFVTYMVVTCIQMAATVDYGILYTSRYLEYRETMGKQESANEALRTSLPTIITSGSILVIASFIVGLVSSVSVISDLGLILSRGCLVSVIVVIFTLPQILLLFDKLIAKTTLKKKFYCNTEKN